MQKYQSVIANRILYIFIFCSFLFSATLSFANDNKDNQVLYIASDIWCPFSCDATNKSLPGYMVEVIEEIFAEYNIEVNYRNMSWARSVLMARQGLFDAVIGASHNDAAKDFIFPTEPLGFGNTQMYVAKDYQLQYTDIDSLKALTIGVADNYSYTPLLDKYIALHKNNPDIVQYVSSDTALLFNVKKLVNHRIDALPEDQSVMSYFLLTHKEFTGEVKSAGDANQGMSNLDRELYIAFSPHNPNAAKYASMLSDGIKKLRQNGRLKEILAKYGLVDWSH